MSTAFKKTVAALLTTLFVAVFAISALQMFAGVFFGYSFWFYVPPVCALAMIAIVIVEWRIVRLLLAYSVFGLFVLSYILRNWRDLGLARQDGVWFVIFPHAIQFALCFGLFLFAHRRR